MVPFLVHSLDLPAARSTRRLLLRKPGGAGGGGWGRADPECHEGLSGQESSSKPLETWYSFPTAAGQDTHSPKWACEQTQSPCLECLRTKPLNLQTVSWTNNTRSPRNRFMTCVCEFISSEQMIFLCLFKRQALSHDRCIHYPTIQKPSDHSSGQHLSLSTSAVGNPAPPESSPPPPGARGQSSDSENTAPHS